LEFNYREGWTVFDPPPGLAYWKNLKPIMSDGQMELSLASDTQLRHHHCRLEPSLRARWWFDRMRAAVDRALDWPTAPLPRPEDLPEAACE
jgi:hypothetical protein